MSVTRNKTRIQRVAYEKRIERARRLTSIHEVVDRLLSDLKGSDLLKKQRARAFISLYTHVNVNTLTLSKIKIGDLNLNHIPAEISIGGEICPLDDEAAEVLTEYIDCTKPLARWLV